MTAIARIEELRDEAPEAIGRVARVILDNPGQFAIIASGSYCVARAVGTMVRPRTLPQALMAGTAAWAASWWLLSEARRRGLITFYGRDAHGCRVPLPYRADASAEA